MNVQALIGLEKVFTIKVTGGMSGKLMDKDMIDALATFALIKEIHRACFAMVKDKLEEGKIAVTVKTEIEHVAPTPIGMNLHMKIKITEIIGRAISFDIRVYDEVEFVAKATHKRIIVDKYIVKSKLKEKQRKAHVIT